MLMRLQATCVIIIQHSTPHVLSVPDPEQVLKGGGGVAEREVNEKNGLIWKKKMVSYGFACGEDRHTLDPPWLCSMVILQSYDLNLM